jgi:hypothetical protein
MNSPFRVADITCLLGGPAPPTVLASAVVLGMPHLSLNGLSETWVLKECGHRHWFLLA